MPPKRKAAAAASGGKRPSLPATPAESPATRRQRTAAADEGTVEETTFVEMPGSRQDWLAPFHEMYITRQLTDVVLSVGDQNVAAHRMMLAAVSERWKAQVREAPSWPKS